MRGLLRTLVFLVGGIGLLVVGAGAFLFYGIYRSTSKLDDVALSPANYEPAAMELARLCQSDPKLFNTDSIGFLDQFDPVWAPPAIAKLHPEDIDVTPDRATVTWGGGFYHCGWQLTRDKTSNWTLRSPRKTGRSRSLKRSTSVLMFV